MDFPLLELLATRELVNAALRERLRERVCLSERVVEDRVTVLLVFSFPLTILTLT